MDPADALMAELDSHALRLEIGNVRQIVTALGGTRATAAAAGVTMRTVQRWVARESGSASQSRGVGRLRGTEIRRRVAVAQFPGKIRGTRVAAPRVVGPSGPGRLRPSQQFPLDDDDNPALAAMIAAWAEGDDAAALRAFEDAFFEAWGMDAPEGFSLTDVESLALQWT